MAAEKLKVVPLSDPGQVQHACPCMEEVPTPWPEALEACRDWIAGHLGSLVEGLHLEQQRGEVIGNMYYGFSERALIPYEIEEGVAILYCEWVQRRHQGQGYARLLFEALTQHLSRGGYKGILVEASGGEEGMSYGHLLQRGFKPIQEVRHKRLMYFPLAQQSVAGKPLKMRIVERDKYPVEILAFSGGFCPCETATSRAALDVAREFGDRVVLREVSITADNVRAYGVARGVYVNGRPIPDDGVPEEAIRQVIREALERF
jgi:GNAT superfamily N-acetyltransferase